MIPHTGLHRITLTRGLLIILLTSAVVLAYLLLPSKAAASSQTGTTGTPSFQPTPTIPPARRLERPFVSEPLDQMEQGALKYWGVCMACHGDRGQGLTDEWRAVYGEDSNCWASGCHAANYPPWGFSIPRDNPAPSMIASGSLSSYGNAQELRDYIQETMPWWNPASLKDDEAWAVTAYVLKLHKVMPPNVELSETTASAIAVQYAVPSRGDERPAIIFLAAVIVLAATGWTAQDILHRRQRHNIKSPVEKNLPLHEKPNFFHHLHPPSIPAEQSRLRYTLGAGGLAVFLSLILLVTGILEMFYYIPVPERAAISIQTITSLVPFGGLIRNMHYWAAQFLVAVMFLHLLRVILTGAYARKRRLNYLIGLGMLTLILLLDFTGYVLRWDEGIRWALTVGTNLLKTIPFIGESMYLLVVGGSQPGSASIERFYTWHIFVLTLGVIILGAWHVFRTRRDGGIAVPPPAMRRETACISRFELVRREVQMMLIAGAGLFILSAILPAPIDAPMTQATAELGDARAPWFFLWVQELLKLGDPFIWGVLAPILFLTNLAALPFVFPEAREGELGKWLPRGNRAAQGIAILLILAAMILTLLSLISSI